MHKQELTIKQMVYFMKEVVPLKVKALREMKVLADEEGLYDSNLINSYIERYSKLRELKDVNGLYELFEEIDRNL